MPAARRRESVEGALPKGQAAAAEAKRPKADDPAGQEARPAEKRKPSARGRSSSLAGRRSRSRRSRKRRRSRDNRDRPEERSRRNQGSPRGKKKDKDKDRSKDVGWRIKDRPKDDHGSAGEGQDRNSGGEHAEEARRQRPRDSSSGELLWSEDWPKAKEGKRDKSIKWSPSLQSRSWGGGVSGWAGTPSGAKWSAGSQGSSPYQQQGKGQAHHTAAGSPVSSWSKTIMALVRHGGSPDKVTGARPFLDMLVEKTVPGLGHRVSRWARLEDLAEAMGVADTKRLLQFLVMHEDSAAESWEGKPPKVRHAVCLEMADGQEPTVLVGAYGKDISARREGHAGELRLPFVQMAQAKGQAPGQGVTFKVANNAFLQLVDNLAPGAPLEPCFKFPEGECQEETPTVTVVFKNRHGTGSASSATPLVA